MYKIVQVNKKTKIADHDYLFEKFTDMYEQCKTLTCKFGGRYSIGVKTDNIKDIIDFMNREDEFRELMVVVYASKNTVEYIASKHANAVIQGVQSPYEVFKNLIGEKQVIFAKGLISVLYNNIEHDEVSMEKALDMLVNEYGKNTVINEVMISKLFVINKIVYPRTVLLQFINLYRWRWSNLEKCVAILGNDVVVGSMTKNIKKLVEEKELYFKTGKGSNLIKSLNTQNINKLYRLLVIDRKGINDIVLLLELYERGIYVNDLLQ